MDWTPEQLAEILRDGDPWSIMPLLFIEHRATKRFVPFSDPTPEQRDWIDTIWNNAEAVCLKSRNVGLGIATQAVHFAKALKAAWRGQALNTLVVAHAEDTAKRHLERYVDFNSRLPDDIRLTVATRNETDLKFIVPGTGEDGTPPEYVWFRAVTAGGKKGEGRGFTQQQVHFTEFAFYADPSRVIGSVTSAMHRGEHYSVVIETTANGSEGYFPLFFEEQGQPDATFIRCFYPWFQNPTFRTQPAPGLTYSDDEKRLAEMYGLDAQQIQWRRNKIKQSTQDDFARDYPATPEEAFAKSGDSYFSPTHVMRQLADIKARMNLSEKAKPPTGMRVFRAPVEGELYAVAVDIGGGVGEDYSVIQVINAVNEQMLCYSDHDRTPSEIADIAVSIALRYNRATLLIESNSIGRSAIYRVEELGYPLFMVNGKPFYVWGNASASNKDEIYGWAKNQIDQGRFLVRDFWTAKELVGISSTGQKRDRKKTRRGHDDHATAWVYALYVAKTLVSARNGREKAIMNTLKSHHAGYRAGGSKVFQTFPSR